MSVILLMKVFFMSVGILGLTILALGNSVADWVADTVVARRGKPEMAIASCFGAPLMSNVVGLSVALIVRKRQINCVDSYSKVIKAPIG